MKTNKGYVFISHSSKDLLKVRKIRNIIEEEGGNPILFYLKCLDNDSPQGEEEQLLKSLLSKEIKARRRFLLCNSKHTAPGRSPYIDWEVEEVNRLKEKNPDEIQIAAIDMENSEETTYLQQVKEFVFKQDQIVVIAALEERKIGWEVVAYLKKENLNVTERIEFSEIRDDVLHRFGHRTKDYVKSFVEEIGPKGIVVYLESQTSGAQTYIQMIKCFFKNSCFLTLDIRHGLSEELCAELAARIKAYIRK